MAWEYGGRDPFCGAPATKGSAYCADHRRLCQIASGSTAAAEASRALTRTGHDAPPPPRELSFLQSLPIPERDLEPDPSPELGQVLDRRETFDGAADDGG
jgi:hypothetical protein